MRKVYFYTKAFLIRHYRVAFYLSLFVCLIGGVASKYSAHSHFIFPVFGFSLASIIRIGTYRVGKIPFFMRDSTWNRYRLKYSGEELDEKYKEMPLTRATWYFLLMILSLFIWVIIEIFI